MLKAKLTSLAHILQTVNQFCYITHPYKLKHQTLSYRYKNKPYWCKKQVSKNSPRCHEFSKYTTECHCFSFFINKTDTVIMIIIIIIIIIPFFELLYASNHLKKWEWKFPCKISISPTVFRPEALLQALPQSFVSSQEGLLKTKLSIAVEKSERFLQVSLDYQLKCPYLKLRYTII